MTQTMLAYQWVCPLCKEQVYQTPYSDMVLSWGEVADHEWVVEPQVNWAMLAWGIHVRTKHADAPLAEIAQIGGRIVEIPFAS